MTARNHPLAKLRFNELVGRSIRELREAAYVSQRGLAADVGISRTMMADIEEGTVACPFFVANNITEVIDCTLDDLAPVMVDTPERVDG